jgi:hypothetical protein
MKKEMMDRLFFGIRVIHHHKMFFAGPSKTRYEQFVEYKNKYGCGL